MFEVVRKPNYLEENYESDYLIRGRVLAWRYLTNPVTACGLAWVYVDTGKIRLEVIVNSNRLQGRLKIGAALSARIWLQGHVLVERDLAARYEGVDQSYETGDFWQALRRDN
jgi:hypothetical protein